VIHLPFHQLADALRCRVFVGGQSQDVKRIADGRERVSQLVRKDRQELVLAAIRLAQRVLRAFAIRDVAREAADVIQMPAFPHPGRIEQDILVRPAAAAHAVGLAPLKINAVVKRGLNEHAIVPLARYFRDSGHIVRFIEYMDVGHTNGWRMDHVVPAAEIVGLIDRAFPLEPVEPNYTGEVAQRWRYRDSGHEIGVIASVTQAFCRDCSRARLSTDGKVYTCLFADAGYDLRALLRGGYSDAQIGNAIAAIWRGRSDRYSEVRTAATPRESRIEMSYIGG